jgi:hypothetical protein
MIFIESSPELNGVYVCLVSLPTIWRSGIPFQVKPDIESNQKYSEYKHEGARKVDINYLFNIMDDERASIN